MDGGGHEEGNRHHIHNIWEVLEHTDSNLGNLMGKGPAAGHCTVTSPSNGFSTQEGPTAPSLGNHGNKQLIFLSIAAIR